MSSLRTVKRAGARLAVIIGLSSLLGILALATVWLGIFASNLFFLLFAIVDLAFGLHFYGSFRLERGRRGSWLSGMAVASWARVMIGRGAMVARA